MATLSEWKLHKADAEAQGICEVCPFKRECDAARTEEDVDAVLASIVAFLADMALALAAQRSGVAA